MSAKYNTEKRIITLMFATNRIIREQTRGQHKFSPSTYFQMEALRLVSDNGLSSMHQLANYLMITPASATSLVTRLVKQDLICRLPDQRDRRVVRLAITARGSKTLRAMLSVVQRQMSVVLKQLTQKRQKQLLEVLEELYSAYKKK